MMNFYVIIITIQTFASTLLITKASIFLSVSYDVLVLLLNFIVNIPILLDMKFWLAAQIPFFCNFQ